MGLAAGAAFPTASSIVLADQNQHRKLHNQSSSYRHRHYSGFIKCSFASPPARSLNGLPILSARQPPQSSTPAAIQQTASTPQALVDTLLSIVEGSDRGAKLEEKERTKVEQIIASLEAHCMDEPLRSPLIFGEWDIVYSSNATATGGPYRSAVGRALLKTKQMIQSITAPNSVGNKVVFDALGFLHGEVSLKGRLEALDNKWIQIQFESPDLKFSSVEFKYGGASTVKIAIIYLDERIRLGRGARGSLFVFKRR